MKSISVVSIILGIIAAVIGLVSRIRITPIFGIDSRAFAGICVIFLLLAIAVNTLPEDL